MVNDFLESTDYGLQPGKSTDISTMETTNLLLQQLIRETRKAHPSQRCVLQIDYSNPAKILDSGADFVTIRFLSSGKPVKAQYVILCNNSDDVINAGINEPVILNAAGTYASGLRLPTANIPVNIFAEVESIQLRTTLNTGGQGIVINNSPTGLGVHGCVQVYAWTVPNSDKDQTE